MYKRQGLDKLFDWIKKNASNQYTENEIDVIHTQVKREIEGQKKNKIIGEEELVM